MAPRDDKDNMACYGVREQRGAEGFMRFASDTPLKTPLLVLRRCAVVVPAEATWRLSLSCLVTSLD